MRALFFIIALAVAQPGQRPPVSPAETLLEPVVLRAINEAPTSAAAIAVIEGADAGAGDILLTCQQGHCLEATHAAQKLHWLIVDKGLQRPARSIRIVSAIDATAARRAKAAIHIAQSESRPLQIIRGLWSTAGIGDEVVEVFARSGSNAVDVRSYENVGQLRLDAFGVPTTTIVTSADASNQHAASVAAASAYFLATLPNAGAESLLSHLTVGAHARLAEDGRRAVAQMGNQQRAGADVLIMFGQAIDREQRRIRSFERFMPEPIDPMLRSRLADMEKAITSVWTSMGITSSPYVPPAERIRGRGGEDRRVVSRLQSSATAEAVALQATPQLAKLSNSAAIAYEIVNFIDGKRSISDIRDAVFAEFGNVPLAAVVEYLESVARTGQISIR